MVGKTFARSHQGSKHIKEKKICQDYSQKHKTKGYALVAVSDGHGGDDYFRSHLGSEFACKEALSAINKFMSILAEKDMLSKNTDALFRQLSISIISKWRDRVAKHHRSKPFEEAELSSLSEKSRERYLANLDDSFIKAYGATLIVVVQSADFWFGLHIGDGKCVAAYPDGTFNEPIPWDEKCFLNRTTSLCDEDAINNFRYCFHTDNLPIALFIGSDGVDDSFATQEQLYGFYEKVLEMYRQYSFSRANRQLDKYLPTLSQKGSGDDISLAFIMGNLN